MPNLVKIGKTAQDDPETRVSQLYTTGVPVPFDIEYACKVPNPTEVEAALHVAFAPNRINPRREFFEIEPEQAIAVLRVINNVEDVTDLFKNDDGDIKQQEKNAADRLRIKRRPNLNFDEMGIPIGAEINSLRNDDYAIVVEPKKVSYGVHPAISLSAATREMMGIDYNLAPAPYWEYEGRSLKEIYDETYN